MRVAVYPPDGGAPFAYRLGRLIDGQHNMNFVTGERTPLEELAQGLAKQAEADYPDHKVVVEHAHDHGDDSSWHPHRPGAPAPAGETHEAELSASQETPINSSGE